jgi:hypothetical protein
VCTRGTVTRGVAHHCPSDTLYSGPRLQSGNACEETFAAGPKCNTAMNVTPDDHMINSLWLVSKKHRTEENIVTLLITVQQIMAGLKPAKSEDYDSVVMRVRCGLIMRK